MGLGQVDYRQLANEFRHNKRLTISFVAIIIGFHAWGIVPQVNDYQSEPPDFYVFVLHHVTNCDAYELPYLHDMPTSARNQIKWYLNCVSWEWFENPKVIPIIFNIMVMPLVYLVGASISKDRLVGLIALLVFINLPLYTDWEGSGTYDMAWAFFLLLSVWLIHRAGSAISFGVSILTKGLAIMYFPAVLYTIWKTNRSKKTILVYCAVFAGVILVALQYSNMVGNAIGFFPERWEDAIYGNISVLWQVIAILGLFVGLKANFTPKNKVQGMGVVWAWIGAALLQAPLIALFTMQDFYSYRYVPFAAFLSIFVGMVLVNMGNWIVEQKVRRAKVPSL